MWNMELNYENYKYKFTTIACSRHYKIWKIKLKNKRVLIFRVNINNKGRGK